jgi:hypothetical protein
MFRRSSLSCLLLVKVSFVAPVFNRLGVILFIRVVNAEHERSISKFHESYTNSFNWDMFSFAFYSSPNSLSSAVVSDAEVDSTNITHLCPGTRTMHNKSVSQRTFVSKCFITWRYSWLFAKSHVTEIERIGVTYRYVLFDVSSLELMVSIVKCD